MTTRTGDNTHIMTRQRPAMQRLASTVPLPLILLAQAAISIIALRNTAFLDEALYIYAGEQLLQSNATVAQYATYFSGYPDFYPAIAGLLNLLGGLEPVRLFSTVCMLFVTSCVFLVTERLYDRTSAYAAAALFAFTGPTLFLSHLATFDALALMFLAMATTLAVSVASARDNQLAMRMSLFIAVLLVLAVAAKYAALLWVPFVIAILAVQTIGEQGWRRSWHYPIVAIAGIAALRWCATPLVTNDVLQGITSTTTNRTAMIPEPVAMLLATILQAGSLIWVLGLLGLLLMPRRERLVSLLLLIASLAAPVYHLYSGESTSLYKHMSFALFFAAPVAGTAIGVVMERISVWWSTHHVLQLAGALGCVAVLVAVLAHILPLSTGSAQTQYASWPSTSQLATTMAPLLSGKHVRCLCEDAEVLEYELSATTTASQYTGPYYFKYQVGTQALIGGAAYTAAIDAGYFDVIELNFGDPMANVAVAAIQSGHAQYRRVAKIPQNNAANIYYMVWTKVVQLSASPLQQESTESPRMHLGEERALSRASHVYPYTGWTDPLPVGRLVAMEHVFGIAEHRLAQKGSGTVYGCPPPQHSSHSSCWPAVPLAGRGTQSALVSSRRAGVSTWFSRFQSR